MRLRHRMPSSNTKRTGEMKATLEVRQCFEDPKLEGFSLIFDAKDRRYFLEFTEEEVKRIMNDWQKKIDRLGV